MRARTKAFCTQVPQELLARRIKGNPDIRLALRPVHSSDGESLQNYVRGLSPQSRYNRFLGGASELPSVGTGACFGRQWS